MAITQQQSRHACMQAGRQLFVCLLNWHPVHLRSMVTSPTSTSLGATVTLMSTVTGLVYLTMT